MVDTGNPNVFTTFKGRYLLVAAPGHVVDTDVVMLSCTNDVQILGDFTLTDYVAESVIFTLPEECRPGKYVAIPVVLQDSVRYSTDILLVGPNGEGSLMLDHDGVRFLMLSGVNFNISDRWY